MKEYIFEIHYCNCSIKKDDIVRIATPDSVSEDKTVEAFRTACVGFRKNTKHGFKVRMILMTYMM